MVSLVECTGVAVGEGDVGRGGPAEAPAPDALRREAAEGVENVDGGGSGREGAVVVVVVGRAVPPKKEDDGEDNCFCGGIGEKPNEEAAVEVGAGMLPP